MDRLGCRYEPFGLSDGFLAARWIIGLPNDLPELPDGSSGLSGSSSGMYYIGVQCQAVCMAIRDYKSGMAAKSLVWAAILWYLTKARCL